MPDHFWKILHKPIIGLSPMDGVTDAAFRIMAVRHGKPDVMFTEFVSAEGLAAGAVKLLQDLTYDTLERPIVAQIFGSSPDAFYKAAVIVAALGFDGLDINMGCPARNVSNHGGGAALIKTPALAKELVRAAKRGIKAWAEGLELAEAGIDSKIISNFQFPLSKKRIPIPVSVKTRIGYDTNAVEEWIPHLLETEPAAISLHGRTLMQMYTGKADWDAIGLAASLVHAYGNGTLILGNGDIAAAAEAHEKVRHFGVDGVLIGRAAFGNPWVFSGHLPTREERLLASIEHAHLFETLVPHKAFVHMRKHLAWYAAGFPGAKELRMALMQPSVNSAAKVEQIMSSIHETQR